MFNGLRVLTGLPLEEAIVHRQDVRVQDLLTRKADPNSYGRMWSHSPLHTAVSCGTLRAVQRLHEAGGDIAQSIVVDGEAFLLADYARGYGSAEVLAYLLEQGAPYAAQRVIPHIGDKTIGVFQTFRRRWTRCTAAAGCILGHQFRAQLNLPKDIATMLAAILWESRRQGVWDMVECE